MSDHQFLRLIPTDDGKSVKTHITWTFDDFLDREEEYRQFIKSPNFLLGKDGEEGVWYLELYPRGRDRLSDHVAIYVFKVYSKTERTSFKFSILDSNFERQLGVSTKQTIKANCSGSPKWLNRAKLKDEAASLLPGGQLRVLGELTVHYETSEVSPSEQVDLLKKSYMEVGETLGQLLDNKDLSDVTIKCGGNDFPCHLLILSVRSPVFRAMFQAKMKESESKEIEIKDIEPAVIAEMLHFIYTGGTNEKALKEMSVELLAAADKYELDTLKEICENKLCSDLKNDNAVEYLILGDMYQAPKLREKSLKKVATNMDSIVKTEAYQRLKQHPDILFEIPKAMIQYK